MPRRTAGLVARAHRKRQRDFICPAWRIILSARYGLWALGYNDAGLVFLGAGVFSLSLEPVILQRLRSCGDYRQCCVRRWVANWRPALPVACSAAERQWRGGRHAGEKMLFGYGLLQQFMLRLMPRYLSQPFNASFWSFRSAFPRWRPRGYILVTVESGLFIFWPSAVCATNAIIALLLVRTFLCWCRGRLLIRTERAALLKTEEK